MFFLRVQSLGFRVFRMFRVLGLRVWGGEPSTQ